MGSYLGHFTSDEKTEGTKTRRDNLLAIAPSEKMESIKNSLPRTCSTRPPQARTVCVPGSLGPHTLGTRIGS